VFKFQIIGIENYPKPLEAPSPALNKPMMVDSSSAMIIDTQYNFERQTNFRQPTPQLGSQFVEETAYPGVDFAVGGAYTPVAEYAPVLDYTPVPKNFNLDDTLIVVEHDSGKVEYIEPLFGFSSATYTADAKLRQVILTIKRNYQYGPGYICLATTTEGTAQAGRDFQPVNQQIIFPDNAESVSHVFHWGLGSEGLQGGWGAGDGSIQTVNFVLRGPDGAIVRSMPGSSSAAVLIIEGSGQPQPLPKPLTDAEYSTHLFLHFMSFFLFFSFVFSSSVVTTSIQHSASADGQIHAPLCGCQQGHDFRHHYSREEQFTEF